MVAAGALERIWIAWERNRRSQTLSHSLDARLFEVVVDWPALIRYPVCIVRTIWILLGNRDALVFVQNPSIVLACVAVLFCKVSGRVVVVDAHNAGVHPPLRGSRWARRVVSFLVRNSALTIVTNLALAEDVQRAGGRAFMLPDPLPPFGSPPPEDRARDVRQILYPCSWADDEPYENVIEAAGMLDQSMHIIITGDPRRKGRVLPQHLPPNVYLTGFIPDEEYIRVLLSCDVVMDLTTRQDCILLGAQEAVAANKPMILSDTEILRRHFDEGAVYTDNSPPSIAACARAAIEQQAELLQGVRNLRERLDRARLDRLEALNRMLLPASR